MDTSPVLDWTGIDPEDKRACENVRRRAYNQRPHVKLRRAAYRKEYRKRPIFKDARRRYRKTHRKELRQCPSYKEYQKKYKQRYNQRPDVKEKWRQYMRNYIKSYAKLPHVKAYHKSYLKRPKAKEHYQRYQRTYQQLYRKTPKGKLYIAARDARHYAKGFKPLCPNGWGCPVDWHHVSPDHPYVVPLPRAVHRAVSGNSSFHFAFNASMICLLYGLDILGGL